MENIKQFKEKLEKEKELLLKEMGPLGKKDKTTGKWEAVLPSEEFSSGESDEADKADVVEEYEETNATLDVLEERLAEVEKALTKIEDGSYGICSVCGKQIEEARLLANVAAPTCIEHKES